MKRILALLFVLVLGMSFATNGGAQRGFGRSGGFGGGRSSGGFSRSGGSFGGSSGGFSRSSPPSFSGPRSSSGSFGRSGSFGNSGRVNSSSANPSRNYGGGYGGSYSRGAGNTYIYGGHSYYGGGFWGGYSMGVLASPWTHYVPFHPGFYVNQPYYSGGQYYAGGFSFTRLILGIVVIGFVVWLVSRMLSGGGGRYKYTNYR